MRGIYLLAFTVFSLYSQDGSVNIKFLSPNGDPFPFSFVPTPNFANSYLNLKFLA